LTIETLFAILKDEEWHDLTKLADQIKVQTGKLTEFLQFASQQDVITYEDKTHRIKIKTEWQKVLPDEIESTITRRSSRQNRTSKPNSIGPATKPKSSQKSPQKATKKQRNSKNS
jgi:hypothetical protein